MSQEVQEADQVSAGEALGELVGDAGHNHQKQIVILAILLDFFSILSFCIFQNKVADSVENLANALEI